MARSVKATVKSSVIGTLTNDSTSAKDDFSLSSSITFTNGTGANQVQRAWYDNGRTLSASATEDIDVYDLASIDIGAGAGLDSLGQAHALTGVKLLYVKNHSDSGGNLHVGGKGTTAAWNSPFNADDDALIVLVPGASITLTAPTAAGFAVADTTNHLLKMTDAGSGCTYDIAILGI